MTPAQALDFLRTKLAEFRQLPAQVRAQRDAAIQLQRAAARAGDKPRVQKIGAEILALDKLAERVTSTSSQLNNLLRLVGAGGLGAIPAAAALAAVGVAGAMAWCLNEWAKRRSNLDALSKGLITPEQYLDISKDTDRPLFGLDLGKLLPVALIAAGAYVVITKRAGGMREWR